MGFGSGYSQKSDNGGKRHNNEMTAHVWNAGNDRDGQSSNGNMFFRGAAIYSYGTHFLLAYRMPDGLVFVNADSYSVSTSGHQSDVRSAIRDRRTVEVKGLTDIGGEWKLLPRLATFLNAVASRGVTAAERKEMQATVRAALLSHAVALSAEVYAPGESRYSWDSDAGKSVTIPGHGEAGAYLAALVGLPAATWPMIQRNAAKAKADAEAAKAKADAEAAESRALRLSDMPAKAWREYMARTGTEYSDSAFVSIGKELKRARGLMLKATRGKLASKARLATIRDRIKSVAREVESFAERRQGRLDRNAVAVHLATVRNWRDASESARMSVTYHSLMNVVRAADYLAERGRMPALKASAARLSIDATAGVAAIRAEGERLATIERENAAKAKAERIELWLAGERVGRISFDAPSGGAALRVIGDTLETSHGAEVPLAHAVKVFRFVKLCRDNNETWRRNGKTIRVGHFQVDRVDCTGDFTAGCHFITWQEVERVARIAGVFDCPASADAVEPSSAAA